MITLPTEETLRQHPMRQYDVAGPRKGDAIVAVWFNDKDGSFGIAEEDGEALDCWFYSTYAELAAVLTESFNETV